MIVFMQSESYNTSGKCPKALKIKGLLACFLNCYSYGYSHSDHGVVTCANETHHLYASVALAFSSGHSSQIGTER